MLRTALAIVALQQALGTIFRAVSFAQSANAVRLSISRCLLHPLITFPEISRERALLMTNFNSVSPTTPTSALPAVAIFIQTLKCINILPSSHQNPNVLKNGPFRSENARLTE